MKKTNTMRLVEKVTGKPIAEAVRYGWDRYETAEEVAAYLGVSHKTAKDWRKRFAAQSEQQPAGVAS